MRVFLAFLFGCLAMTEAAAQKVTATHSCPSGQFMSAIQSKCVPPHRMSTLPLEDRQPMRFEALQISMMIIWIQATGTITQDTPRIFEEFLKTNDAKLTKNIYFHSPGGNLIAGIKLGQMIRENGLNTSIGRSILLDGESMDVFEYKESICASACAYAFLGGVTRSYTGDRQYGLHRFSSPAKQMNADDAQIVSSLIAAYIESMGVNQAVLQLAAMTPFEGEVLWIPVNLGKNLRVIYDKSGEADFRVEKRGNRTVVAFELAFRERRYDGLIMCGNRQPMIAIFDTGRSMPADLKVTNGFPAEFQTGRGAKVVARATYHEPTVKGGAPYMLFVMDQLSAQMFEGDGLSLVNIWNPNIETEVRGKTGFDAFYPRVRWADAVTAFQIHIKANNARRTLPVILDDCR